MPGAPAWARNTVPKLGGKLRQSHIALVVGTRPEAIKLSPVAHAFVDRDQAPRLLITGQHPGLELEDHQLQGFAATPVNCPGQPDPMLHADLVRAALKRLLPTDLPDLMIVQGDTSSALGGALAARELDVSPMSRPAFGPTIPMNHGRKRKTGSRSIGWLTCCSHRPAATPPTSAVTGYRDASM